MGLFSKSHGDKFDPEEQRAWKESQRKLKEAAKVAHQGQLKFQQADEHLSHAESAKQDADEASRKRAELEAEAQKHLQQVEDFKTKHPELHDARLSAAREAEEKQAAAQRAQGDVKQAEQMARQKSAALHQLEPKLKHHHEHHSALEDQLEQHRKHLRESEAAHHSRRSEHEALRKEHEHNLGEVSRLDAAHAPLRSEMQELERRMAELRTRHDESERGLHAAKTRANDSHVRLGDYDPEEHNKALAAVQSHKQREKELAAELAAAKEKAHEHQDRHEAATAEHERALKHHADLKSSVSPLFQDVENARAAQEKAERELAEMEAQAKNSHNAYRETMGLAGEHGRRAAELDAVADKHTKGYMRMRKEGDDALARKEKLWEEAKNHGDSGVGHFKEKVTGMEERLAHIGEKIKDKLDGDDTPRTTDGSVTTQGTAAHAQHSTEPSPRSSVAGDSTTPTGSKKGGLKGLFSKN